MCCWRTLLTQSHVAFPRFFVPWCYALIPEGSALLFPWAKNRMPLCPASNILNTQTESCKRMTSEGPEGGQTQTGKHQYTSNTPSSSYETRGMLYLSNKWCNESSNTSHPTACTNTNSSGCCGENLWRPRK